MWHEIIRPLYRRTVGVLPILNSCRRFEDNLFVPDIYDFSKYLYLEEDSCGWFRFFFRFLHLFFFPLLTDMFSDLESL
jgi:hypothetical protein